MTEPSARAQANQHVPQAVRLLLTVFAMLVLTAFAAACSSSSSDDDATAEEEAAEAAEPTPAPTTVEEGEQPPEVVVIARGDWDTGHFQAAIYAQLISELGYDVSNPATNEVGPANLYPAMARGEIDVWANGWFPHHDEFLAQELSDGTTVDAAVTVIGSQMPSGGVLGFLASKWWVEDLNISYVDDIGQNGDLSTQLDADGDGKGDIIGCDADWPCHNDINQLISDNGWRLDQLAGDYDQLMSGAESRVGNGLPTLLFTWAPSGYVGSLVPGDDMVWLGVRNPIVDGVRPADFGADLCRAEPCQTGFETADIQAVANSEFLVEHADIEALLEVVEIPAAAVAEQNLAMQRGEDSNEDIERHASEWIEANRALADDWLDAG